MNKINSEIFRAYDIRGIYPTEINKETAFLIGRALVDFLEKRENKKKQKLKIVVGRDNRLSSKVLFQNLTKGILTQGGDILDIGLSSTPRFYFSVLSSKADGGIQITASHNPPQYNGFKITREKAIPISVESGLKEIKEIIEKGDFQEKSKKKARIEKKDFLKEYVEENLKLSQFKDFSQLKSFKVIVDTANSVSGIDIKSLFSKLSCKFFHLFSKLDGSFPNHHPDPLLSENLNFLVKKIKKEKADLGIAFDGDGDRVVFIDEKGEIIRGDFITALIAKEILRKNPGQKILYEVRSSQIVKEIIEKAGGVAVLGRAGHSLIKERMRKEKILFAGELSGHYFFEKIGFFEAPLWVVLEILKIIFKEKKPISEIIQPFRVYFQSGEINFKVKNKEKKLREIENYFLKEAKKITKIDGITLEFKDWWFNLRPSNTEELLRLNIEVKERKLLKQKKILISQIIKK